MNIKRVILRDTKRGETMRKGLMETCAMVVLEGDEIKRRVYEDWNRLDKRGSEEPDQWAPVPLVVKIKEEVVTLPDELIELHNLR